jgi:hypothetical protein
MVPQVRITPRSAYCRYLLRPPVAQERLLKTAWADGTRHLLSTPIELGQKLAALTPRPRINLILYHGVLAPSRTGLSQALPRRLRISRRSVTIEPPTVAPHV